MVVVCYHFVDLAEYVTDRAEGFSSNEIVTRSSSSDHRNRNNYGRHASRNGGSVSSGNGERGGGVIPSTRPYPAPPPHKYTLAHRSTIDKAVGVMRPPPSSHGNGSSSSTTKMSLFRPPLPSSSRSEIVISQPCSTFGSKMDTAVRSRRRFLPLATAQRNALLVK